MKVFGWSLAAVAVVLSVAAVLLLKPAPALPGSAGTAATAVIVEQGRYLATVGNCVSCHTGPGGQPFAGGHEFHTAFGTIYSTNITPDNESGIGGWSLEAFRRAMREGIAADGQHLYPVFPYQHYALLTDDDISAIYAYLRSLRAVSYQPPANDMTFPFGWRNLLGAWKWLYLDAQPFRQDETRSAAWNRGAYLADGLGHCGACHSPRNAFGAIKVDEAYSGGTYLDEVEPGMVRPWSAVNLTPSAAGLGAWSVDELAAYLGTGHSPRAGTFGPMNKVIVNSISQMSDEDVRAMAHYFNELEASDHGQAAAATADEMREGEREYSIHCATCHLPTGLLNEKAPPVADSAVVLAPDAASLINVILYGAQVPAPSPAGAWDSMEGFELKLDDEEVAALATYMRNSWGHAAGRVTASQVAAQR